MKLPVLSATAAAVLLALPAAAQSNEELLKELRALRDRVAELERRLAGQETAPRPGQWGMTPEQARELNRIAVKTEALQDNFEDQGFKQLRISGMLDPTYIRTRTGGGSFAFLNGFTGAGGDLSYPKDGFAYDNSYFGQAMLDLQKETDDGTRWRLTLAPQKNASSGYNVGSVVHEASVSLELTDNQTRLWLGQIPDWSGYEYIWSHQQPLITHNLLFDFTLPSFYQGAALDITRGKWWSRVLVGNMNASRYDRDHRAPVLAWRVDYSKGEFDGFGFAGAHGKSFGERIDLVEADAYYIRGDWTWQGQVAWGRLRNGAASGDARWSGVSGLVGYNFTPRLKAVMRGDYVLNERNGGGMFGSVPAECMLQERDGNGSLTGAMGSDGSLLRMPSACADGRNGFGPKMVLAADSGEWEPDPSGKGASRYALSLGLNYLYGLNTTLKLEARLDGANGNVFLYPDGSWRKTNRLLGASVVVSF